MQNEFESDTANKEGDWTNNKEMNPAANSSVTENGVLESDDSTAEETWRDDGAADANDKFADPTRATGKAEDDVDFTNDKTDE